MIEDVHFPSHSFLLTFSEFVPNYNKKPRPHRGRSYMRREPRSITPDSSLHLNSSLTDPGESKWKTTRLFAG